MSDTIFKPVNLKIDTRTLKRNLPAQAQGRLMHQFQNSEVLTCLVREVAAEVQELYDAIVDVVKVYSLAEAQGKQLDILGRIVGQNRTVANIADKQWFGTDTEDATTLGGQDRAPVFVDGAPQFGNLIVDDDSYRQLIMAKIFKNHTRAASTAEITLFAKFLTGFDVSFSRDGPMQIELIVPVGMPLRLINRLLSFIDDVGVERKYLVPVPATAAFSKLTYRPQIPFAADRAGSGPDLGSAALSRGIF